MSEWHRLDDEMWDDAAIANLAVQMPDALILIDEEGCLRWGNAATERLFGWPVANWLGASGLDLIHPDDLDMALLSLTSVQAKEVGTPLEVRVRTANGWRLVEMIGVALTSKGKDSILLSLRDLTQRRRWEVASGDENRFRTLVHNSATITMLVLPGGEVQSVSASLCRMLGHDPEVVEGRPLVDLIDPEDRGLLASALGRSMASPPRANQVPVTVEVRLLQRSRKGSVPFELHIVNLIDDPTVAGFVVSGHDISRLRAAQEELRSLANKDSLTGLPNRSSLDRHLASVLDRGVSAAVAFLDLDRFKPVNDLLGHDAGDELLRKLALRLQTEIRGRDFVARFGGDEFVVVAEIGPDEAERLVERLERLVAEPFELASGPAQVFASVGVAFSSASHSAESLLAEADANMYAVKRGRRGNPAAPSMGIGERRQLSEQLGVALAENQLEVHYQPIWRLAEETLWGFEALVRWRHPTRGLLMPAAFLDLAEDAGRDGELGEMVLRAACSHGLAFAPPGSVICVNVSANQIAGDTFADLIAAVLDESGLEASRLCLEISERSILERPAHGPSTSVVRSLERLAGLGVHMAIDDFGTGYSSLTHVLQFPVSALKIDRSFVQGIASSRQSHSVVSAVVELARGMGIDAVAEGVETEAQLKALVEMGCPSAQGYLLGRPTPASAGVPVMRV